MAKSVDRIRTTISVDKEVHQVFVRMAEAAGMSVSRCMGEWLADTVDGAEFVAQKMEEARKSPKLVMQEMQAMSLGMVDMATSTLDMMRSGKLRRQDAQSAPDSATSAPLPPSSNTGVLVPLSPMKPKSKSRSKKL